MDQHPPTHNHQNVSVTFHTATQEVIKKKWSSTHTPTQHNKTFLTFHTPYLYHNYHMRAQEDEEVEQTPRSYTGDDEDLEGAPAMDVRHTSDQNQHSRSSHSQHTHTLAPNQQQQHNQQHQNHQQQSSAAAATNRSQQPHAKCDLSSRMSEGGSNTQSGGKGHNASMPQQMSQQQRPQTATSGSSSTVRSNTPQQQQTTGGASNSVNADDNSGSVQTPPTPNAWDVLFGSDGEEEHMQDKGEGKRGQASGGVKGGSNAKASSVSDRAAQQATEPAGSSQEGGEVSVWVLTNVHVGDCIASFALRECTQQHAHLNRVHSLTIMVYTHNLPTPTHTGGIRRSRRHQPYLTAAAS